MMARLNLPMKALCFTPALEALQTFVEKENQQIDAVVEDS